MWRGSARRWVRPGAWLTLAALGCASPPPAAAPPAARGKLTASWASDNSRNVTSYEQARALWNFGEVSTSEAGALSVAIVNADGQRVAEIPLAR